MNSEIQELKNKITSLESQLKSYIPRRRVRRIYKLLGNILEADTDVSPHIQTLKDFINKIEKEGKAEAGQEVKTAIEHLLSIRER